jgi:predicted secreted protein
MDKETLKKIICDFIDSVDEIMDFSITNDVEEIDSSTFDGKDVIRIPTGFTNINITTYKRRD